MTNNERKINVEHGKQGFQEAEKKAASGANLGASAVGGDARQAVADAFDEFQAQWPDEKVAMRWVGRSNARSAVLGNVKALEFLEDGTGKESHTLVKRLERAAAQQPDAEMSAVYAQSADALRRHLDDSGVEDTSTPLDKFDGYRATKIQEWEGREGMGFNMTLTRNGKAVGDITNEGCGGSDSSYFKDQQESYLFHQRAQLLTSRTFEPEGNVSLSLLTAAEMSRKRSVPVIFDGDNFDASGSYVSASVPKGWTREDYIDALGKNKGNLAKGIKIWDKDAADFVAPN